MKIEDLTEIERKAIETAIGREGIFRFQVELSRQLLAAKVVSRTDKTVGYYADIFVPTELTITCSSFQENYPRFECSARHPDGENSIFFIVYIRNGLISMLEAVSTSEWPSDENGILFDQ